MRKSIDNLDENIEFNRKRWGNPDGWLEKDQFGYRWGGGVQQSVGGFARFCDKFLRPFISQRYDHSILELSPGAGRFTSELIRYASSIDLLDMNQACIDICRTRLNYYPIKVNYYVNDGKQCDMVTGNKYSFIACFDSMVHMHPDIIRGYVTQLATCLEPGGYMWLDHSGAGARDAGHRTDMTPERMAEFGRDAKLTLIDQTFRNDHDCITVFQRPA